MSRIEESMEKALKMRDKSLPARRREPLPPALPDLPLSRSDNQPHLRDYLDILLRRRWIVIAFLSTVVATVTVASFVMTPLYMATVILDLDVGKTDLVSFKDVSEGARGLETQYNILKSRTLAERVAARLPAELQPQSSGVGVNAPLMRSIEASRPPSGNVKPESAQHMLAGISAGTIMGNLDVQPVKKTSLVNLNYVAEDPAVAAAVANAIADEYVIFTHDSMLEPTKQGGERLRREVDEMKVVLETSEKQLNDYIAGNPFLVSTSDTNYENLLGRKFATLTEELDKAIADRLQREAIYHEVKKSGIDYSIVVDKPVIQGLMRQLMDLEAEYSRLLLIHKPEYPKMIQLKKQIDDVKKRIDAEEQNSIDTLHTDYKLALKKEKLLSTAIEELRGDIHNFQQDMIYFLTLKRDVETNRNIYDSLLQRLKEVDVSSALTESSAKVLDRARTPRDPFKPKKAFNIILSLIFGLFGGTFLAFFVEYFDNSLKTDEEVERLSSLPLLGKVPLTTSDPRSFFQNMSEGNVAFTEAFRSICARIQFSNMPKQILITSPMEQEGKTIISISTAMSLISSREKGVLIDADMRRPDVHSIFNLDNSTGLSSFLAGSCEFDGLIKKSPYAGLDIITAGPLPPNPSELLNSSRMQDLVDGLAAIYDYIIFDSAPVLGMSDSLVLSTMADGVILVAKAFQTPGDALVQTTKALQSVNARVMGVIFNGVNFKSKYAYSSYYYSSYLNSGNGQKGNLSA